MGEALIQREFPVCEGKGVSRVLRSRTNLARPQLRTMPVKAWESRLQSFASVHSQLGEWTNQPFGLFAIGLTGRFRNGRGQASLTPNNRLEG